MLNPLRNVVSRLCGARLHLGITTKGIALARTSGGWNKKISLLADQALSSDQLKNQCDALLTLPSCTTLPLLVTLSDEWGHLFMVTPPHNAEHYSDLVAAATMRFQALYGKVSADWQINADWQVDRPFLACAYPRSLLNTLQQIAQERRMPLLSVRPYFVTVWNQWSSKLKPNNWFGVVQDATLTLGITSELHPQHLIGIRTIAIPTHGQNRDWIAEQLTRTALQHNVTAPKQIQVVGNQHHYWGDKAATPVVDQLVLNLVEQQNQSSTVASLPQILSPARQLIYCGVGA
ncbi:hypothetical protein [Solimicrobium silvestre]|uniref:Uncharacterized protein n=1 Tax=Solimicrobium silvestre TaxID=2099400 RepID=A0A2S9GYA5_9BURK|nr:hypothetical protein [Solimicrobium silvestre]PRC92699.1 hypothetical protein S2091_2754 [Solimicrobium silvestre]